MNVHEDDFDETAIEPAARRAAAPSVLVSEDGETIEA